MAGRLLSETILTPFRGRPELPRISHVSRDVARRSIAGIAFVFALTFLYLAQVSQVTTTSFDIQQMEIEYHQWQERNQEMERQIAELESPQHVYLYAEAHGMTARTDAEYLIIAPRQEP